MVWSKQQSKAIMEWGNWNFLETFLPHGIMVSYISTNTESYVDWSEEGSDDGITY